MPIQGDYMFQLSTGDNIQLAAWHYLKVIVTITNVEPQAVVQLSTVRQDRLTGFSLTVLFVLRSAIRTWVQLAPLASGCLLS